MAAPDEGCAQRPTDRATAKHPDSHVLDHTRRTVRATMGWTNPAEEGAMSQDTPMQHGGMPIKVDWPDSEDLTLRVSVGACRLRLHAGGLGAFVEGSYEDPTGTLPLVVTQEYGEVRLAQQTRLSDVRGFKAAVPVLDLSLGTGRPFSLHLATGASDVHLDLGGLGLRRVSVRMGAGTAEIRFGSPVMGDLERFDCEAGAASISVQGLGFASPERATIVGGAAGYDLSFDGPLRRDVQTKITTAGAGVTVRVPVETAARIGVLSVLAGLTVRDGFQTWEDSYWTQAGVDGRRPLLSIDTSITLGGLELVATGNVVEPPGIEPGSL
jgi:hypothetical protein